MKKNILYALLVGGAMLLGSCENNFDAQIYGKLSTLTFPSTADEYEDYMLSSYLPFQNKWSYTWGDGTNYPWYIPSNGIYHGLIPVQMKRQNGILRPTGSFGQI